MAGGPALAEGAAEDEQLAPAGGVGDFGRLVGGDEALVEGLDVGPAGDRQGSHGGRDTSRSPTAKSNLALATLIPTARFPFGCHWALPGRAGCRSCLADAGLW